MHLFETEENFAKNLY